MFRMLFRRIRYGITSKIMRIGMGLIALAAAIIFMLLLLTGVINQKKVAVFFYNLVYHTAEKTGEEIENIIENDGEGSIISITNEGVYFNNNKPDSSSSINPENAIEGLSDLIHSNDETNNETNEDENNEDENNEENNSEDNENVENGTNEN